MKSLTTYIIIYIKMNLNAFIFYLRKLPFVSEIIPSSIYSKYKLKNLIGFLGVGFAYVKNFLRQILTIYIMVIWIPHFVTGIGFGSKAFHNGHAFYLYAFLLVVIPAMLESKLFKVSQMDYTMLNHFQIDPQIYYKLKVVMYTLGECLVALLALYYILNDLKLSIILVIIKSSFIVLGNFSYLYLYKRFNKVVNKRVRLIVSTLLTIGVYVGHYHRFLPDMIYYSMLYSVCVVLIVLSIMSWSYILTFKGFKTIANKFANKDVFTLTISVSSGNFTEGETGLMKLKEGECEAYFNKHKEESPVQYIHNAFTARYKRTLRNMFINSYFLMFFIFIVVGVLLRQNIIDVASENIILYSNSLFIILLSMSRVGEYTQLCFRQVDLSLLMNQFYSQKSIRHLMNLRMIDILKRTCMSGLIFTLGIYVFILVANINIALEIVIKVSITCLLVLIIHEIYYFMVYYGIQPYTRSLTVSSLFYKVSNWFFGLFCVLLLFARKDITVLIGPLIGVLCCMIGVYYIVYSRVERTFKLR